MPQLLWIFCSFTHLRRSRLPPKFNVLFCTTQDLSIKFHCNPFITDWVMLHDVMSLWYWSWVMSALKLGSGQSQQQQWQPRENREWWQCDFVVWWGREYPCGKTNLIAGTFPTHTLSCICGNMVSSNKPKTLYKTSHYEVAHSRECRSSIATITFKLRITRWWNRIKVRLFAEARNHIMMKENHKYYRS